MPRACRPADLDTWLTVRWALPRWPACCALICKPLEFRLWRQVLPSGVCQLILRQPRSALVLYYLRSWLLV